MGILGERDREIESTQSSKWLFKLVPPTGSEPISFCGTGSPGEPSLAKHCMDLSGRGKEKGTEEMEHNP